MKEGLLKRIKRFFSRPEVRGGITRSRRSFASATDVIARILSSFVYIASLACAVVILVYAGFDSNAVDRHLLLTVMHGCQAVFVLTVLFNIIFRYKATMRDSLLFKRLADILVLLTALPVLQNRYFLFAALGLYSVAELCYGTMQMLGRRTNPSLILSASFLIFILGGSLVLMLPRCTTGTLHYVDALFMAASAVSMTGLSTIDATATFTPLGWLVIAILMQIGALGVLTFTSFFALFFSGRSSIYNQLLMRDFIYSKSLSSLMPVILYILSFTLVVEAAGTAAIYFSLPDDFGLDTSWRFGFSAFHSLSAFCNCGFSTIPGGMSNPALMNGNQAIYIVFTVLILAGGIGFPNLVNFKDVGAEYLRRLKSVLTGRPYIHRVHVYDLNTKLVLVLTAILFIGGATGFYLLEYNHSMAAMSSSQKIIQAFFNSATVRTAGFNSIPITAWLNVTFLLAMFLMWVGCSSQSMGGGIKINAFAAVLLNLRSIARGQKGVVAFGRRLSPDSVRRANATVCFSIFTIFGYAVLLMLLQPELPMKAVMFEAFSAITTIGMSLGITPELSNVSKILVATAMFLGRVGIISVLCGMFTQHSDNSEHLLTDDIIIN